MDRLFLAIGTPGLGELLIILLIVLILFGGSKIPQIARALGEGIREFKKASKESSKDNTDGDKK